MPGQPTEGTSSAPEIPGELSTSQAAGLFEQMLGGAEDEPELSTDNIVETDDPDEGEDLPPAEEAEDGDAEGEGSDVEQPGDETQEPIQTVAELAEALELSQEELAANLKTTIKVNGEEIEVTLAELQAGYQKDRDYRQKTEALARERDGFHQTAREVAQAYQRESANLAGFLNEAQKILIGELDSQHLAELRHTDPAEWIAVREEYAQRLQRLELIRQAAAEQYTASEQRNQYLTQSKLAEILPREKEQLVSKLQESKLGDWNEAAQKRLATYLTSSGFNPQEVSQAYDHRLVILAEKARLYDESKKVTDKVVEKVLKAPKKVLKPKSTPNPANVQRGKLNQLKGRLKQTGHIKDAAALLEARLG